MRFDEKRSLKKRALAGHGDYRGVHIAPGGQNGLSPNLGPRKIHHIIETQSAAYYPYSRHTRTYF